MKSTKDQMVMPQMCPSLQSNEQALIRKDHTIPWESGLSLVCQEYGISFHDREIVHKAMLDLAQSINRRTT
jgi:hypothetical protein